MSGAHTRELVVRPSSLDERGAGVVLTEELRLHVPGLLPGEEALVAVEQLSHHLKPGAPREAWGVVRRLISAAAERIPPACPAYGECGACVIQHLGYPSQLRWKRERVAAALARFSAPSWPAIEECVPSPRILGYRNQGKYVYGLEGSGAENRKLTLGAYAPRSHRLVDLLGCQLVEPVIDQVAVAVRHLLVERQVPPFDERRRTGLVRYVVLRSNRRGEVLVALVTGPDSWPAGRELGETLRASEPRVVGVVQNINPSRGNVIFSAQERSLSGSPLLSEILSGVGVRVGARAFLQLNREVAELIYCRVAEAARERSAMPRVLDLYAGVGGIAFAVAALAEEVVAVEVNPEAAAAGSEAAQAAGLTRVRFVTGDAARGIGMTDAADLVVLNPPRAGIDERVAAGLARLRPRLCAYVSCNPDSLARDLHRLSTAGLAPVRITPFDMLPHTPHVEVLTLLVPAP
jgi:23S rRNA (uracil1939-C5)-methyltransferase